MSVRFFAHHFVRLMLMVAATCAPRQVFADWPSSPIVNVPLCSAANSQLTPVIATDGAGGAIVAWIDQRGGTNSDVYAQNVRSDGSVNINWPANGVAVCTAAGDQVNVRVVSESSGGVILTWLDKRTDTGDIYAQHVVASGTVDASWPVNGVAICSAAGSQTSPVTVSDGSGGAIIAWVDFRSDTITSDVYAQHVLATGTVDSNWPVDGRALCLAAGNQQRLAITLDGQGGAIVAWQDFRGGATADIYCSHVLGNGVVDPAWPVDGLIVCNATGSQLVPDVVGDSQHGALVSWYDFRGGSTSDVYAQHVRSTGSVDLTWPANGRPLCSATGNQQIPRSVSDGAGGAIVAWSDSRNAATGPDVYAQHIRADGVVDPAWPVDGRDLCTAFGGQTNHTIAQDGAGGAIVSWEDTRSSQFDVYSHHVLASGAVDPLWPTNGRAICTASANQQLPVTLADGSGGAIVAWHDFRVTGGVSADIYAQRVQADGQLGGSVVDVPADQLLALTLNELRPNPWIGGALTLRFSLASDAAATLEVLDAAGRRVTSRQLNPPSAGGRVETLELTSRLAPGVYFARLRQGPAERVKRFVVLE